MIGAIISMLTKAKEVAEFLVKYPFMVACIAADRYLLPAFNPLCPYPRNAGEVLQNPKRLLDLVKVGGRAGIPSDAVAVSYHPDAVGLESEPDKNATILLGDLTYESRGVKKTLGVFIKFPTARPQTVWAKAIFPTISTHQREVAFYNNIVSHFTDTLKIPFPASVPQCYFAGWSRCFDRAIIITEKIDTLQFVSIPDWRGISVARIKAQLRQAAKVHAATWGGFGKGLDVIKEREGHAWLDGIIRIFWNKLPPIEKVHWDAIIRRCKSAPVCFSHLDCRAGNMLFKGDGDDGVELYMTDWEACGILPVMWDVAYAMVCSLPTDVRREHQDEIIDGYLADLRQELAMRKASGFYATYNNTGAQPLELPSRNDCLDMIKVSYFVINFFGFVLVCIGNVGKTQGNTTHDVDTWSSRLKAAQREILADPDRTYQRILQLDNAQYEELKAYLESI